MTGESLIVAYEFINLYKQINKVPLNYHFHEIIKIKPNLLNFYNFG